MLSQLFIVASLCLPPLPRPSATCGCLFPKLSDSAIASVSLKAAGAVFVGTVTSVVDTMLVDTILPSGRFQVGGRRATFTVLSGWKGPRAPAVVVLTGTGYSDCGYQFIVGKRYLVFATVGANSILHTMSCAPTEDLEGARKYLPGLGEPTVRYAPSDSTSEPT